MIRKKHWLKKIIVKYNKMEEDKKVRKYDFHQKLILKIINENYDYFVKCMEKDADLYFKDRDDLTEDRKMELKDFCLNFYERATRIVKHILENEDVEEIFIIKIGNEDKDDI